MSSFLPSNYNEQSLQLDQIESIDDENSVDSVSSYSSRGYKPKRAHSSKVGFPTSLHKRGSGSQVSAKSIASDVDSRVGTSINESNLFEHAGSIREIAKHHSGSKALQMILSKASPDKVVFILEDIGDITDLCMN